MRVFAQNNHCPSQVLFAFDDATVPGVHRVRWAVAYATRRGCDRLVRRVVGRIGQAEWDKSEKDFVLSLDYGITEPEALQYLADLPRSTVRVASPEVVRIGGLAPRNAFHPKLYLFDAVAETGYVVGSANLTESALISNTEVVAAGKEALVAGTWDDVWTAVAADTSPLTAQLLDAYRDARTKPDRPALEPETLPQARGIEAGQQPVFREAISDGLVPGRFTHFWIEAGSMSSSGSHSQLELPRGGNRFFGYQHTNYGSDHVTIGYPLLTLRDLRWTDRPLTWHGNNRMERINLPTPAQGGFDYRDTAVLFRRQAEGFEIEVLPWDDSGAVAWRAASAGGSLIFRVGEKGGRMCGLF